MNIENFTLNGMIFEKALVSSNLTEEQAENSIKFCQIIGKYKTNDISSYKKWIHYITSTLQRENVPKENVLKFIDEYINNSFFSSGEPRSVCVAENLTDINMFREILSIFYNKIIAPRYSKVKKKVEVK